MTPRRVGFCLKRLRLLLLGAAFSTPAAAQEAPNDVERFERSAEQIRRETAGQVIRDAPPGQRPLFDYGAYLTFSYLSFDDSAGENHAYRGYDLVGYARLNVEGAHDLYLRGRLSYQDFNAGDSFAGEADELEGRIEEAYYQFDLAAYRRAHRSNTAGDANLTVRLGRQFEIWGNGLILSQYVDGGHVVVEQGGLLLSLLASVTAYDLTVDFDASRPDFQDETRRAFYGAMLSAQIGRHRPFAYTMLQRDENSEGPEAIGPISTGYRYDSFYLGMGVNGSVTDRISYGAEFVYEGGEALSSSFDTNTQRPVAQETDPISAYAGEFRLDYLFGDPGRSRLGMGVLFASGDSDRGNTSNTFAGNRPGTTDHAFNALGFVNDGLAFSPSFSNVAVLRATASTYPLNSVPALGELQAGVEVFAFAKLRQHAAIDEPTDTSRYLGWEPDLFINWQVAEDVTLVMRYGIFFPGSAIPSDDHRQFFYAGLTYAF